MKWKRVLLGTLIVAVLRLTFAFFFAIGLATIGGCAHQTFKLPQNDIPKENLASREVQCSHYREFTLYLRYKNVPPDVRANFLPADCIFGSKAAGTRAFFGEVKPHDITPITPLN